MTPADRAEAAALVERLGAAFRARDREAALACFVPDDDISYVGSEAGEHADGRAAVAALLAALFGRSEAYSWRVREVSLSGRADVAYLRCEADGVATGDDGGTETFAYRLSGLVEHTPYGWRWRACHGCEPGAPVAAGA